MRRSMSLPNRLQESASQLSHTQLVQYGIFVLLCLMTLGAMSFGPSLHNLFSSVQDKYLVIPVLVFFGTVLTDKKGCKTWQFRLCIALAAWYFLTQQIHVLQKSDEHNFAYFFSQLLVAFPFAVLTQDEHRQYGIRLWGAIMVVAGAILSLLSFLFVADMLPGLFQNYVYYWLDIRVWVLFHPNQSGIIFGLGMLFALDFGKQSKSLWSRTLLWIVSLCCFVALALTNSRTSVLAACCMLAGYGFVHFPNRKALPKFLAAAAAALVILIGSYMVSDFIYQTNFDRVRDHAAEEAAMAKAVTSAQDATKSETTPVESAPTEQNEIEALITTRDSDANKATFTGRTKIWASVLQAAKEDPTILLYGTDRKTDKMYDQLGHAHNAWLETMLRTGVIGLLFLLFFTVLTIRNAFILLFTCNDPWKCTVALAALGMLVVGLMEPAIFYYSNAFFPSSFTMMLCSGYLTVWVRKENTSL